MIRRILALVVVFGGVALVAAMLTKATDRRPALDSNGSPKTGRWISWIEEHSQWLAQIDSADGS